MKTTSSLPLLKTTSLLYLLATVFILGCSKNDGTPDPDPLPAIEYDSYISHEYIKKYSVSSIKSLYSGLTFLYPQAGELEGLAQYDVELYKVEYNTLLNGEVVVASGLLCIPISEGTSFPIISFQNGTNTAHANAPTKDLTNPLFQYLHATASMGYAMLIPDYLGFGSSEETTHPYMHKESTVDAVENMITAVLEMMENELINITWDEDLYLIGYSQGGWATLVTHYDIANSQDLPFEVSASACGAGPYDLSVVQNFMFENATYPQPVYMAYTGVSYHSLGIIDNALTDMFNEPYATSLPAYFEGQYTNGEINDLLTYNVDELITSGFLNGINDDPLFSSYRLAIEDNSIYGWNSEKPIRLYHGSIDTYVPPATTEKVYAEFVSAGATDMVSYTPLPGQTHTTGIIPMALDAMIWFSELENKSTPIAALK